MIAWVATILAVLFGLPWLIVCVGYWFMNMKKARRYAVTLKNNEGAFIALCTQKRWDRWVFEDITVTPTNPGAHVEHVTSKLHVPYRNILYYQEIQETANVAQ